MHGERGPDGKEKEQYNTCFQELRRKAAENEGNDINSKVINLQNDLRTAEALCFREREQTIKKPYISESTFELIKGRQKARDEKDLRTEWRYNKIIKYAIRKDKRKYWAQQLEK